ncbi:hypothetical protein BDZ97DRAFT_1757126 [Flammula alnicola]|nr:hypothetical protein BDZ97DRAFT_1757126 [Flammula alnicola]
MSLTKGSHLLLVPFPAWGHTRPILVLATRLVHEREDVIVTVLVGPSVLEKAHSDISTQFRHTAESDSARRRIRLVSAFNSNEKDLFKHLPPFAEAYPAAYKTLLETKPITCATTGTTFDVAPAPSAIVMDFFALPQLRATRAITGYSVPVIAWASGGTSSMIRLFGPENIGGLGDFGAKIDAEAARTGKTPEEIGEKAHGSVVQVAGLPAMYDYEFFPQKVHFLVLSVYMRGSRYLIAWVRCPIASVIRGAYLFLQESDGTIITACEAYENTGALKAMKSWLSDWNKSSFALGHFCLLVFLRNVFWPHVEEYIDEVMEVLMEKQFPFVVSKGPILQMSSVMRRPLPEYPKATGWFLTHGGNGSITEALGSGIPLICWPFDADQPGGAAHLTNQRGGMKPMLRHGRAPKGTREAVGDEMRQVIDDCRGPKGEAMRQNAERLKKEFARSWEDGGEGKRELQHF